MSQFELVAILLILTAVLSEVTVIVFVRAS
jgi:hypothetical protein